VQRYLTAKSVNEGRQSLLMSVFFKIPLQALILLPGALVFVFYLFDPPPPLFNPVHEAEIRSSERAVEYRQLEGEFDAAFESRRRAAIALIDAQDGRDVTHVDGTRGAFATASLRVADVRRRAAALVKEVSGDGG
jgi:hypothetical protein